MAGLIWVAYQFRAAITMSLQFIVPGPRSSCRGLKKQEKASQ